MVLILVNWCFGAPWIGECISCAVWFWCCCKWIYPMLVSISLVCGCQKVLWVCFCFCVVVVWGKNKWKSWDGGGFWDGCGGGTTSGLTGFGSAVRGGGCIGILVASVVGINVRDGGTGDGGCAIRSGGGGACVRDAKAS